MNDFYVYAHQDDSGIRYVGKGRGNRAWNFLQRSKLWNQNFPPDSRPKVLIIEENLSEWEAFNLEAIYIGELISAGYDLLNIASGGPSGWDERARKKLTEMRSGVNAPWYGKKRDPEVFEKGNRTKIERGTITRYWAGKKRDPELIKKLVEASHTPEANAKREAKKALGDYGWTDERRERLSEIMTGRIVTPEHAANISKAKKGIPSGRKGEKFSDEHKRKISEACKGRVYGKDVQEKRLETWKARGGTSAKAKKVRCIDTGEVFRSCKAAAEAKTDGKGIKVIQQCCVGAKKSYKGLHWEHVKEA